MGRYIGVLEFGCIGVDLLRVGLLIISFGIWYRWEVVVFWC